MEDIQAGQCDRNAELVHLREPVRETVYAMSWSLAQATEHLDGDQASLPRLPSGRPRMSAKVVLALEDIGWGPARHWMRVQIIYELTRMCSVWQDNAT